VPKKDSFSKFPRKEGIKYLRCQHLVEKTQQSEISCVWIGETQRIILCPICSKLWDGQAIGHVMAVMKYFNPIIEQEWEGADIPESIMLERDDKGFFKTKQQDDGKIGFFRRLAYKVFPRYFDKEFPSE